MEITNQSVIEFISMLEEPRYSDILVLTQLGKDITKKDPKMWGEIIGFGNLHYRYKTGHEGNMPLFSFANRKQAITLYMSYEINQFEELNELGKFKTGKGCLYIKKLSDVKLDVLKRLIKSAIKETLRLPFITDNETEKS